MPLLLLITFALVGAIPVAGTNQGSRPAVASRTPVLPARLGTSDGRVFVVSRRGSDQSPGTRARPWRTIQQALRALRPGQTALVRGGIYRESLVMDRAGTRRRPITVRNYPGERPVVRQAGQSSLDSPLRITAGAAFFRFRGFVLENQSHHRSQNLWISDGGRLTGPPRTHDIEISRCEIRNGAGTGILVSPNTSNVQLLGNLVHDNGDGEHQHQGIYFQGQRGLIANNAVYEQDAGLGIAIRGNYPDSDTTVPMPSRGTIVTSNTAVANGLSGIMVENNAANTTVVNNISAFNGGWAVRGYNNRSGEVLGGNVAYNNLGFGNRGAGQYGNSEGSVLSFVRGNRIADPLFINRGAHDYRLRPESPAIGKALPGLTPRHDLRGRRRGARPDLGAIER